MRREKRICRLTAYLLNIELVIGSIELMLLIFVSNNMAKAFGNAIRYFSAFIILLYVIKRFARRKVYSDEIVLVGGMVIFFIIAAIRLNEVLMNKAVWVPIITHYLYVAPLFIFSRQMKNYEEFVNELKPYSYLALVYGIMSGFILNIYTSEYMTFSYSLMIPAILSFLFLIYDKNLIHGVISAVLVVTIAIKGARGPILCIGASFICILALYFKRLSIKKLFVLEAIVLASICTIVFWNDILRVLTNVFPDSRTLYVFKELNTVDGFLTGRLPGYKACIDLIGNNPLLGYGVITDRYALCMELGYGEMVQGVYPHNLFLEFILQYGLLIGSIMLICIAVFSFGVFGKFRLMNNAEQILCLAVFPSTLSGMLVSNSYIESPRFWLMLGMGMTLISRTRCKKASARDEMNNTINGGKMNEYD